MISDWLAFLQYQLGAATDASGRAVADTSWSSQLQGSESAWMILEGVHVLTLMLFAGSILFVDLRLLGIAFRKTPVSRVSQTLLPWTIAGFGAMLITGFALFYANPLEYFHNFAFRLKVLFLIVAAINVFWFHVRVQSSRSEWDSAERPPRIVRVAAMTSLSLWFLVIIAGRYMAYDWVKCMNPPAFVSAVAQCDVYDAALEKAEQELAQ